MRIELTHTVKHGGHIYTKGDVITADEGLGTYFCACGWARDVSGQTPTASPEQNVTLDVQSATHQSRASEAK